MAGIADQKDKKYGRHKAVKKDILQKNEIQQINFRIIRELWKKFGSRPKEELYDIMDTTESIYYQVTGGINNVNYEKKNLKIKDQELQKYFYGEQLIDIGITKDEWEKFIIGDEKTEVKGKLSVKIDEIHKKYKLPMIMRPRDSFEHLLFLCKYGKECPTGDLKLMLLYDILSDLSEQEICECKDDKLLENILKVSKSKLRDIETVYRCIELMNRKNKK